MRNIETVQAIYQAFGRGDVEAILGHLADDVEWEYGRIDAGVPWLKTRRGRAQVPAFFEALAGLELQRFQPKVVLGDGNVVVALIDVALVVRATGRRIVEEDEVHLWHFDTDGRVLRFCHKLDAHQHWLAWRGEPANG